MGGKEMLPMEPNVDILDVERRIRSGLLAGNPAALELIWTHHADALFTVLLGILFSRHDAEDALQEVFLRIARKNRAVASARNLKGYLLRMARNAAIDQINRIRRTRTRDLAAQADWLVPEIPRPGDPEQAARLAGFLQEVPEEQRTILLLKVYQDLTFQEIAQQLDISANTAASRFRYGMAKLRALLGKDCP